MFFQGLLRTTAAQAMAASAAARTLTRIPTSTTHTVLSRRMASGGFPSPAAKRQPAGYLFGEPGGRRKWYWWEPAWYFMFYPSIAIWLVFMYYTPHKSPAQKARIEAHRRLEERGEDFGWPFPPNYRESTTKHTGMW
ncbi:hypothetical protein HDV00_001332 [Rhizophlyctis rosea]|nr:hypothetical protein HDV00_001332 [Rhizophlyctis rosea]